MRGGSKVLPARWCPSPSERDRAAAKPPRPRRLCPPGAVRGTERLSLEPAMATGPDHKQVAVGRPVQQRSRSRLGRDHRIDHQSVHRGEHPVERHAGPLQARQGLRSRLLSEPATADRVRPDHQALVVAQDLEPGMVSRLGSVGHGHHPRGTPCSDARSALATTAEAKDLGASARRPRAGAAMPAVAVPGSAEPEQHLRESRDVDLAVHACARALRRELVPSARPPPKRQT